MRGKKAESRAWSVQPQAGVGWGLGAGVHGLACRVLILQVCPRVPPEAGNPSQEGSPLGQELSRPLRPISMPRMVGFCVSGDMNIKSMGSG